MTLQEIEDRVAQLDLTEGRELIFSLLLAYGLPKAGIARLRSGTYNKSSESGETLWKNRVLDRYVEDSNADLHAAIDDAAADERVRRQRPRFVVVRDPIRLLALDTVTRGTLDIGLSELPAHTAFFLPWAGIEKQQLESLHYADVKAAQRMALLYAEIVKANAIETEQDAHRLNVFFARLLFCFFAEDTEVFPKGSFTDAVASLTAPSGADTADFLDALFGVLDTPMDEREGVPSHLRAFGYVNGSLFSAQAPAPRFTARARSIVIDSGTLDWSQINPDIFGSMMQAVVQPGERQAYGMHYTSVENILKVIRPLFLDSLDAELEKADTAAKLRRFITRLSRIRVFDPACGSGNFLIISYKELRRREHRALQRLADLDPGSAKLFTFSEIQLESFHGIEIDDFAHEVAMLSLWLAKHQMNVEFRELFGAEIPLIPLRDAGNVVCGNATRLDWEEVCPKDGGELYVIGNPPYVGSNLQTAAQKQEFTDLFGAKCPKRLDYVALWFLKGAEFVSDGHAELAFVATNSVCQGDHVGLLWPLIYESGAQITFAHQSFRWTNRARGNAGVTCVVVGLSANPPSSRRLFVGDLGMTLTTGNIGPYLLPTPHNTIVHPRAEPLSDLPPMRFGSMPNDGGHLLLTESEHESLVAENPASERFLRRFAGANEFLGRAVRYCLWIDEGAAPDALAIHAIRARVNRVEAMRRNSKRPATRALADKPWRFGEVRHRDGISIIVPEVSSERREIIPMGFLDEATVISNKAFAIYNPEPWVFALLQSRLHTVWAGTVGGRLETRYSYSSVLVYNTFPVPLLSDADRDALTGHALAILEARERYADRALGDLYLPEKMPPDLQRAHAALDATVDALYGIAGGASDADRLAVLFALYEQMTSEQAVAA